MNFEGRQGLLVLYASQTGNAIDVAERVGREAERGGCPSVEVFSMDAFDASCLSKEQVVVFVVSTTGQGENPPAMKGFWKFLLQSNLSNHWLEGLRYAVFGLGDSGYQKYNFTAKKLDKRIMDLGAEPIIEKGLGDDQHPSGYEGALDPWLLSLWRKLNQLNSMILPRVSDIYDTSRKTLGRPKYQVTYHSSNELQSDFSSTSGTYQYQDLNSFGKMVARVRPMSWVAQHIDGSMRNCFLRMVTNKRLTKDDPDRDVRHFELDILSSGCEYQVGDVLEILPTQNPIAVDAFIKRCNLDPDCYITVQPNANNIESIEPHLNAFGGRIKLITFVALTMDINSASPCRFFFEVMSFYAAAEHEKEKLQYFTSSQGRDDLYQYNQKERRTVLEILEDFPSVQMPFEWLVQLVPPLRTRAFSISSSPLAHPNQVHLTVTVVSWTTPYKRRRRGLCSFWLAGLDPHDNRENFIPAWIHRGSLHPPPPSLPLILIGPGTGCAPFRAFVEERAAQRESGPTAPVLFFFGCRNQESDFLYKDFWLSQAQKGVLSAETGGGFFVAFSRDQPSKIYVQHKMKEQRGLIWSLLISGAAIYLSGSSTKMPADVTSALEEIIADETGSSKDSAARWLKRLERAGKFQIEAWS